MSLWPNRRAAHVPMLLRSATTWIFPSTTDFKKTLVQPIDFLGYTDMSARAKVLGIMQEGKGSVPAVTGPANIEVILDRTPFYAQAGGQLADQGEILSDDGAVLEVDDVQKRSRISSCTSAV